MSILCQGWKILFFKGYLDGGKKEAEMLPNWFIWEAMLESLVFMN